MRHFIDELKRRHVIRTCVAYLAGSWLLVQLLETLFPIFEIPETRIRWVVILLAVGLVPVLALSWVFKWTPEGFRKDVDAAAERDPLALHPGVSRAGILRSTRSPRHLTWRTYSKAVCEPPVTASALPPS